MDIIDTIFLDKISEEAKASSRLRFSYDMRNSENDSSQRVLNALEPGTVVPIHRHMQSSEVVFVVRGKIKLMIYDDNGKIQSSNIIGPDTSSKGYIIPIGMWHTVECLAKKTLIFESKDGRYEPLSTSDILNL